MLVLPSRLANRSSNGRWRQLQCVSLRRPSSENRLFCADNFLILPCSRCRPKNMGGASKSTTRSHIARIRTGLLFSRHFPLIYLFPSPRRVNVILDSSLALSAWLLPLQGPGGSRRGGKAAPRRAGSCGKCSSASGCTSAQGSLRESPRGAAFDRGGFFQVGLPRDME